MDLDIFRTTLVGVCQRLNAIDEKLAEQRELIDQVVIIFYISKKNIGENLGSHSC